MLWSRLLALGGVVLVVAGVFLPWVSVMNEHQVTGVRATGFLPLVLMSPVLVMALLGNRWPKISLEISLAMIFLAGILTGYLLWQISQINQLDQAWSELSGQGLVEIEVRLGSGLWFQFAGCALTAVSGILWKKGAGQG